MKRYTLIASLVCNALFVALIVSHYILKPVQRQSTKVYYFVNRDKLFAKLPVTKSDIILVGDSHIDNFECAEMFNSLSIKNRGIFYDTSKGLLMRYRDFTYGCPSKIFIEIGINDLQNGISIDTTKANIVNLIQGIHSISSQTHIYLQSVLPVGKSLGKLNDLNNRRIILNKAYKEIAIQQHITFLDLDPYFSVNSWLSPIYNSGDMVHLNYAGYRKWKDILMNYL